MLVVLPLFVGHVVRAAGWMVVFSTKGFVNSILGGLGLIQQPLTIMYTEAAVIVGVVAINLPLVYRTFIGQNNWPFGAALAFVLMTATLVLSVTANVVVQRRYRR